MAAYVEMEFYSLKYARDMKYHGFVTSAADFGYLLERHGIEPDHIKSLALDGQKRDDAERLARDAKEKLNGL